MRKYIPIVLFFLLLVSCKDKATIGNSDKSIDAIKDADKISSIIRNPVSASTPKDTSNVAKIEFETDFYEFGEIKEGKKAKHSFKFKNTGKVNLVITAAKSTCGCTVPSWPEEPIAPGGSGVIDVVFDSKGKKGAISQPVRITANTTPQNSVIHMKGVVLAAN